MARRAAGVVVATSTERSIVETLSRILPAAAGSYEQCLLDLSGPSRRSYRGVAHELREVLRETLNYLAPDVEVMAEAGFKLEKDATRPTQRQKSLYVLRKRRLSREEISAPELAVSLVDELGAAITRSAYTRGAKDAHTASSAPEVRQLKMYIDAVLGELLEIHAQKAA
jgi:hypothetical protein